MKGTTNELRKNIVICCEDIYEGNTILLEIWVQDESGNSDFASTYVNVYNHFNVCDTQDGSKQISGDIRTENGVVVNNVVMGTNTNNEEDVLCKNGIFDYALNRRKLHACPC